MPRLHLIRAVPAVVLGVALLAGCGSAGDDAPAATGPSAAAASADASGPDPAAMTPGDPGSAVTDASAPAPAPPAGEASAAPAPAAPGLAPAQPPAAQPSAGAAQNAAPDTALDGHWASHGVALDVVLSSGIATSRSNLGTCQGNTTCTGSHVYAVTAEGSGLRLTVTQNTVLSATGPRTELVPTLLAQPGDYYVLTPVSPTRVSSVLYTANGSHKVPPTDPNGIGTPVLCREEDPNTDGACGA